MFVVSHSYQDRAEKYVRLDGKLNFGAGSEGGDVLHVVKNYGLVPQGVIIDLFLTSSVLPEVRSRNQRQLALGSGLEHSYRRVHGSA